MTDDRTIIATDADAEFDGPCNDESFMGILTTAINVGLPGDACKPHWGNIHTLDDRYLDPLVYSPGKPGDRVQFYVTDLGLRILRWGLERAIEEGEFNSSSSYSPTNSSASSIGFKPLDTAPGT